MSKRFSERAQRVILIAHEETKRLKHETVKPEHMLLGLIALGEGLGMRILTACVGANPRSLRKLTESALGPGTIVDLLLGEFPFDSADKKILEYSVEEAQRLHQDTVGTEHLLLGLLRVEQTTLILEKTGATYDAV